MKCGQMSIGQNSNRGNHMKHGLSVQKRLREVILGSLGAKCQLELLGLGVHRRQPLPRDQGGDKLYHFR